MNPDDKDAVAAEKVENFIKSLGPAEPLAEVRSRCAFGGSKAPNSDAKIPIIIALWRILSSILRSKSGSSRRVSSPSVASGSISASSSSPRMSSGMALSMAAAKTFCCNLFDHLPGGKAKRAAGEQGAAQPPLKRGRPAEASAAVRGTAPGRVLFCVTRSLLTIFLFANYIRLKKPGKARGSIIYGRAAASL